MCACVFILAVHLCQFEQAYLFSLGYLFPQHYCISLSVTMQPAWVFQLLIFYSISSSSHFILSLLMLIRFSLQLGPENFVSTYMPFPHFLSSEIHKWSFSEQYYINSLFSFIMFCVSSVSSVALGYPCAIKILPLSNL